MVTCSHTGCAADGTPGIRNVSHRYCCSSAVMNTATQSGAGCAAPRATRPTAATAIAARAEKRRMLFGNGEMVYCDGLTPLRVGHQTRPMKDSEVAVAFFAFAGAAFVLFLFGVKFFLKRHVKTERVPFGLPVRAARGWRAALAFVTVRANSRDAGAAAGVRPCDDREPVRRPRGYGRRGIADSPAATSALPRARCDATRHAPARRADGPARRIGVKSIALLHSHPHGARSCHRPPHRGLPVRACLPRPQAPLRQLHGHQVRRACGAAQRPAARLLPHARGSSL